MSNYMYSIEPYTGNIICHSGVLGQKWGYIKGKLVDASKQAKGQLDQFGNYVYERAKSGQLGSRTINKLKTGASTLGRNARSTATNLINRTKAGTDTLSGNVGNALRGSRNSTLSRIGRNMYNNSSKGKTNAKAAQARTDALNKKGNRYMYETKTLAGKFDVAKRNDKQAAERLRNNINDFTNNFDKAVESGVNGFKDWVGTFITGDEYKKKSR